VTQTPLDSAPTAEPRVDVITRPQAEPVDAATSGRRRWVWLLLVGALAAAVYWRVEASKVPEAGAPAAAASRSVPVVAAPARRGDMPIYLGGLGSVAAFNTVTVKSRVDGELMRVAFREGQFVHQGDLLGEIDPRPYQVQLEQAQGQMARDQAQLKDAKMNLERYRDLAAKDFIARQQVDDQAAAVAQYEAGLKVDQAAIDNAKLLLSYCHITAPISGRVGLRLVDAGNMVHASDPNGLLVITQVQPIAVLFTLPEDELPPVLSRLHSGDPLVTEAFDRAGQTRLATGTLLTVDNQIDQSTGTTRLKAEFPNEDNALFPNQFVNVRLLLDVRQDAVIAPAAAIQRGPQGTFVYVVKADQIVEVRPVTVGPSAGADAMIEQGLTPGEVVVVDGVDKLRAGAPVQVRMAERAAATPGPGA
jgi:multidrug efflux system membrane fusion protein